MAKTRSDAYKMARSDRPRYQKLIKRAETMSAEYRLWAFNAMLRYGSNLAATHHGLFVALYDRVLHPLDVFRANIRHTMRYSVHDWDAYRAFENELAAIESAYRDWLMSDYWRTMKQHSGTGAL
jgi:hypothetical protein